MGGWEAYGSPQKVLYPRNPPNRETHISWYLAEQIGIEILIARGICTGGWEAYFVVETTHMKTL